MTAAEPLGTRLRRWGARVTGHHRTVLLTYPGLRLGNILYFALHAHRHQAAGGDYRVIDPAPADGWGRAIPGLGPLLLPPDRLHWTDRRVHVPASFLQSFGVDFTAAELEQFVRDRLLDVLVPEPGPAAHDVVINVRRGDYYSDPTFRELFGFDVLDYTVRALAQLEDQTGRTRSILVVSDDPGWCATHLRFLARGGRDVSWSATTDGPLANLRSIARARRLIITNSTFSYWGAYVSNVLHTDNHGEIWVPEIHSRGVHGGRPWQHDPRWHSLEVTQP